MIYWFTGQPGHGKTLCAIDRALQFKDAGRVVYVCNVRDFDYEKTGMLPMTPEQFCDWPNFLPDGAVCLVDEAYEKGMLPKRAPGAKVPNHVERLATHRHRGLDFIFVCQSPEKQVDSFVHDLIERHIHVRRRFGTKFQHLREFDKYARDPLRGTPLVLRRQRLPKRPMGTYKSTEMDTTERKIPWYYFALILGLPLALYYFYWVFAGMGERLTGVGQAGLPTVAAGEGAALHGASATGGAATLKAPLTMQEYAARFIPRVASQPWSAPAYDGMSIPSDPPRVFCMSSGSGVMDDGEVEEGSCTCLTEQGTRYRMAEPVCRMVARNGQYEPYFDERAQRTADALGMIEKNVEVINQRENNMEPTVISGKLTDVGEVSNVVVAPKAHF